METLWEDLSRNVSDVEPPSWHGDILAEREEFLRQGSEQFVSWEDAKRELRERLL